MVRSARFTPRTVRQLTTVPTAPELFRPGVQTAAGWLALEGAGASQNTTSLAAAADSRAVPTIEAGTLMRAPTEEATGMVATTTTTIPDATGAADFMVMPGVVGHRRSPSVGAGAERPGLATMDIFSTRIPSTQLQRFGSRII